MEAGNRKIEPYKGIAVTYDEIRPSYPEKLIQDVILKTGIKEGDRLLEIGPGTGKAMVQFAEKGFAIHGVELGEDMAEVFRAKCANYPQVSIEVAPFEEWENPGGEKYDMIYCAQAFHWLDASVKYKKCHKYLKDDGFLVLFWYNPSSSELELTCEIEDKAEKIIERYLKSSTTHKEKPERRVHSSATGEDERKAEMEASGIFKLIEKIDYTHEVKNNAQQYMKVKKSIPAVASVLDGLDDETVGKMGREIEALVNNYGGYVGTLFNFSLYILKKLGHKQFMI
jgi:2-polyprenyl-3-methyl-5-hydroxy-6-metoxy-1,4-benzoquinol methylase